MFIPSFLKKSTDSKVKLWEGEGIWDTNFYILQQESLYSDTSANE